MPPGRNPGNADTQNPQTSQFISRILAILSFIQSVDKPTRLSLIAQETRIPKTTTHRLLVELVEHDMVRRHGNYYTLGPSVLRLAEKRGSEREVLRRAIKPVLLQLHSRTGYIVGLAVPNSSSIRFIDTVYNETYIPTIQKLESNYPLSTSAAGKILLAYDSNLTTCIVPGHRGSAQKNNTIAIPPDFAEELFRIREQRMSTVAASASTDIAAAAVPIFDAEQRAVAALTLGAYNDCFQLALARVMLRKAVDHVALLTRRHAAQPCQS
ncbi:IclR family transcriptional regulator [Amycolatopsis alba]|nr:IclR family transcriptional regulator C-terminal domain-containing protein [Amycolatopsis alba]